MRWIFGSLALGLLVGAAYVLMKYLNERIEIEGEALTWIDWKGTLRAKVASSEVRHMKKGPMGTTSILVTATGQIPIWTSLPEYGILMSILKQAKEGFAGWQERNSRSQPDGYVPTAASFNYRASYLTFFAIFWFGFCLIFLGFAIAPALGVMGNSIEGTGGSLFLIFGITPFMAIGVYLLGKAFNEKVEFGASGIRLIDWRGKVAVESSFDEILGTETEVHSGEGGSTTELKVYTIHGTISVIQYIKNYAMLKSEIEKVIASRR